MIWHIQRGVLSLNTGALLQCLQPPGEYGDELSRVLAIHRVYFRGIPILIFGWCKGQLHPSKKNIRWSRNYSKY